MIVSVALLMFLYLAIRQRRQLDSASLSALLAVALRAGMPPRDAVAQVAELMDHPVRKRQLQRAAERMARGATLSEALQAERVPVPPSFLGTLRLVETSGDIRPFLEATADQYQQRALVRGRLLRLSIYPTFVLVILAETAAFNCTYIMPTFVSLFEGMNLSLPLPTKLVIALAKSGALGLDLVVLLILAALAALVSRAGGYLPYLGGLHLMAACEESASVIGSLVKGGIPLSRALETAAQASPRSSLAPALAQAALDVARGDRLGASLARQSRVPRLLAWMCDLGEHNEDLGATLLDVAAYYRERLATLSDRGIRLWQPVLMGCVATVVGGYVLSIFLPLYQMIGGML